jgi:hypothetical protein
MAFPEKPLELQRRKVKQRGTNGTPLFDWGVAEQRRKANVEIQKRLEDARKLAARLEAQKARAKKLSKKELVIRKSKYASQLIHFLWLNSASALERRDAEYQQDLREARSDLNDVYASLPETEKYHADQLRSLFDDRAFTSILNRINSRAKGNDVARLRQALAAYAKFVADRKMYNYEEVVLQVTAIYQWLSPK